MPKKKDKPQRPVLTDARTPLAQPRALPSYQDATPRFCLHHLCPEFNVSRLQNDQKAAFADALQRRASMTWNQLTLAPRHGLGLETLPSTSIRAPIPPNFADREKFIVFRYSGNLPMGGIRAEDTFHILWIEGTINSLYDHG